MAGVNATNVGTTYVNILEGASETLNQDSKARSRVTQDYEWRGSHIEHKLHVARNQAVGFMQDGSTFPVPDKEDYVSMKVGRKVVGGSIQISDVVMATASKSPEVAVDVVSSHTEGLMKNILKFENFFFMRDGTGQVATSPAAGTPSASYGGIGDTKVAVDDARAFWDKGVYDVYQSDGTTYLGQMTVTSVTQAPLASGYFEVNVSALTFNMTASAKIYWKGANGIAYTGLDALIDNSVAGTFQSVTTATYPRWSSMVLSNGGTARDLDPSLFRQACAGILQKAGGEKPVTGLTAMATTWQLNNLDELYESALRLSPDSSTGGLSTPSFQSTVGKITVDFDVDAPYGKIFLVDFSQIYRGIQKKLGWRMDGGQVLKRSDVASVWTATAIEVAELYIKGRNSSGKITDLNETKSVAY